MEQLFLHHTVFCHIVGIIFGPLPGLDWRSFADIVVILSDNCVVDPLPLLLLGEKTGREQPIVVELNVPLGRASRNLKINGEVSAVRFEQEIVVPKTGGHLTVLLRVPVMSRLTMNYGFWSARVERS